ncbi:MAG: di-heme oxidoredictase family protein [Polyangiales bacterium]
MAAAGCADEAPGYVLRGDDRPGEPVEGLTDAQQARFARGDTVFERVFREGEGLGPVYIRAACAACHAGDSKGPGVVRRMALVEADGFTPAADQSGLRFGSVVRELVVSPATRAVLPPTERSDLKVSERVGPAVFARGWMDAIDAREIERVAAELRAAGGMVHGRVPTLADGRLGRFGLKATVATLEDFAANAFLGDMGMTSPSRAEEVPNPEGLRDDARLGLDLSRDQVDDAAFYVRALAAPPRVGLTARGAELFARAGCATCHTPSLATRADFELTAMAGARAEVFTDMLLHDMGVGLADGVAEGAAGPRDWRTAPLIGMRFLRSYLHDGRARTLEGAVRLHRSEGSEASASVDAFDALSATDRSALLDYVRAL